MPRPRKVAETRAVLRLDDLRVPVRIITEAGRLNSRASLTEKALIMRLPYGANAAQRKKIIADNEQWARQLYHRQPGAFAQFRRPAPAAAYQFTYGPDIYRIEVSQHGLMQHNITAVGPRELSVKMSQAAVDDGVDPTEVTERLLAKWFAGRELGRVRDRVHELNDRHFGSNVRSVKLSYTSSRWGSCSTKGNIRLSSRLLLAPPVVLDTVIIHELAHLTEANHSPAFWRLVATAMPEYKQHDRWLKTHGGSLNFIPEAAAPE